MRRCLSVPTARAQSVNHTVDALRRPFQRYNRQMAFAISELHVESEVIAWLSGDERSWSGTACASWPAFARLDAWSSISRS